MTYKSVSDGVQDWTVQAYSQVKYVASFLESFWKPFIAQLSTPNNSPLQGKFWKIGSLGVCIIGTWEQKIGTKEKNGVYCIPGMFNQIQL